MKINTKTIIPFLVFVLLIVILILILNFNLESNEINNDMSDTKELLIKLALLINKEEDMPTNTIAKTKTTLIANNIPAEIIEPITEIQNDLILPTHDKKSGNEENKINSNYYPQNEALRWLANHQEADGHWDAGKYEGNRTHETDCAVTGMALLAFYCSGHTAKAGRWKNKLKPTLDWLINTQRPNGSWVSNNYTNAICTLALAEATGMGAGFEVKNSAEIATDYILKQQNANGLFDYTGPSTAGDMSVTGWCIMALKSAILAGIKEKEIKEAYHKCEDFLNKSVNTKDNTSNSKGLAWYTPNNIGTGDHGGACQAIAMVIRQYLGWERNEPWLQAVAEGQIAHIPTHYQGMDVYRVYFTQLGLINMDRKYWTPWYNSVRKIIDNAQIKEGEFKGSWSPNGGSCNKGGRVLYTSIMQIVGEIYPRRTSVMK